MTISQTARVLGPADGLAGFLGTSRGTDWGGLMAGATLTAIPVVIFFLLVQRRIAFGLTAGAVRG